MSKKSRMIFGLNAIAVLMCAPALHAGLDDHVLLWHTNMGSVGEDFGHAIAVDGSGYVYVAGWSEATWGNPVYPHTGGRDAFVAKLNSRGERLWHTFMGSSDWDEARSVAVDGVGNVYVAGTSDASWGSPIHSHAGGSDGFAAKLDSDGERQWHTFMGNDGTDWGRDIAVHRSGAVYVGGVGGSKWDTLPVDDPLGDVDVWVTKLSAAGVRQWYTFMGSVGLDFVRSIAVDRNSNVYAAGRSFATWGSPINAYSGGPSDAAVWKLDSSGARLWHTYMGSSGGEDYGFGIAVDGIGNAYVSGLSPMTWGTPINPFVSGAGESEGYAAKLDSNGTREWHTFVGKEVGGWGMAIDGSRNIFVGGVPQTVQLSPIGILQRKYTMPAGASGEGGCIAVGTSTNVYFVGGIDFDWGTPVDPHVGPTGSWDAYVVKFGGPWLDFFIGEPELPSEH